jgi:lincosamide nucleotidyltransferase A/C/D/E
MTSDRQIALGMAASDVLAALDALASAACRTWVGGGWGVDALAGCQTRAHRDLDLAVDAEHEAAAIEALGRLSFKVETDWRPVRVELVAEASRWVDLHPVVFDAEGNGRQADVDGGHFEYPRDCFTVGSIGGVAVPCLLPTTGDPGGPDQSHRPRLTRAQGAARLHPGLQRPGRHDRGPGRHRRGSHGRLTPDFGHLEPMLHAARGELEAAGVTDAPEVVLADAGYWHHHQMEKITERGIELLIPPDSSRRKGARPGWQGGAYTAMREQLATDRGAELYGKRQPMIEPVFGQT